jgi:hypothetical protein
MTINLDDNKIAFGLLSKEEQEHLRSWPHGLECWESITDTWYRISLKGFPPDSIHPLNVYRTIPAPVEPEREAVWLAYDDAYGMFLTKSRHGARRHLKTARGFAFRIEFDAATGDNPTIEKENFDDR